MGASAETVRNISQVKKVRLEDVCRVGFDTAEEVIVGWVAQDQEQDQHRGKKCRGRVPAPYKFALS